MGVISSIWSKSISEAPHSKVAWDGVGGYDMHVHAIPGSIGIIMNFLISQLALVKDSNFRKNRSDIFI